MSVGGQGECSVANFIQKSFQILENKEYESIIHWMANGREFAIKEIDEFQEHILPKFFRHRNINSFIRQLNMYGFHKSRKDPSKNIFSHPFFLRSQPHLLPLVKRKIKIDDKNEEEHLKAIVQLPKKKLQEPELPQLPSRKSLHSLTLIKEVPRESPRGEGVRGEGPRGEERAGEKEPVVTKTEIAGSMLFLSLKSFGLTIEISPFKGLMEKSCIMDSNPELYLKMRDNNSMCNAEENLPEDDDMLSIEDEIERERRVFQNRRSGVSILNTHNMLDDL